MLEGIANWIWQRWRRHYLVAVILTVFVSTVATLAIPAGSVPFLIYGGIERTFGLIATVLGLFIVGAVAVGVSLRRAHEPISAWGRGEDVDPEVVWRTTIAFPELMTKRTVQLCWPILVASSLVARRLIEDTLGFATAIFIGLCVTFACLAVMLLVSIRFMYLPVLREVWPLVPATAQLPTGGVGLRSRILLISFGLVSAAALVGGAATSRGLTPTQGYLYAVAAALLFGPYAVLLVSMTVLDPSLKPLSVLQDATRRIAAGTYDEQLPVLAGDEFGELSAAFNDMQKGLRERASLQQAFGSYVDPSLAERLLQQDDSVFDGEEVDVTVFFADVRGFTTYASGVGARDAVARLNDLFGLVVPIIRAHGGHANGYAGDSVLAVFGTPNPLANHADRAIAAAWEVQRAVCEQFGESLRIGIGMNTGPVIAGTIGGGGKLEFTVIGDAVNVAARVEQLTKETGDGILLTKATLDVLARRPDVVTRGAFAIRGKAEPLELFAVR